MKHLTLLLLPFLLMGTGCNIEITELTEEPAEEVIIETEEPTEADNVIHEVIEEGQIYVSFIQNIHDWVFPEESAETIRRVVELHEEYQVPVDLYYNDQILQAHLDVDPELIELIKDSEYATVSWHIRPPHPLYSGFDNVDLNEMTDEEIYETLKLVETSRLDLETGLPIEGEPGGYAYMKELIGYAPRVVTHTTGPHGKIMSQVYTEMGALFTVSHGSTYTLDMERHGLHYRPEQQEVKLYEETYQRGFDPETKFEEWTQDWDGEEDWFVNLKYHENNYYTTGTTFGPVYWKDYNSGRKHVTEVPYDLSAGETYTTMKSPRIQEEKWQIYEETLEYVANNLDWLTPVTSKELEEMLSKLLEE
jgi:hypothetical protein